MTKHGLSSNENYCRDVTHNLRLRRLLFADSADHTTSSVTTYGREDFERRRSANQPTGEAIHASVLAVGPALMTTSAALGVGFAALSLSPWQSVASFGLVSTVAIAAALASTLLVLPALLVVAARD